MIPIRFPLLTALLCASCAMSRSAEAAGGGKARGPMTLEVDLREAPRRLFHAKLKLQVPGGEVALLYPKWVPGEHGPTGPIKDLAGLRFTSSGKPLAWRRDDRDMTRFLIDAPRGELEVGLDFISAPPTEGGFSQGASATARLALLSWNQVLLYPEGAAAHDFEVKASLRVPDGWRIATALPLESQQGSQSAFGKVSLETLVDSPVLAGAHLREVPIGPAGGAPHFLDLAADSESDLAITPEEKASYDRLVAEAQALFGAHHYGSYHFLLTLSDSVAHFGLEHHQSSDDRTAARTLVEKDLFAASATLLPHEFTHSWNGKYRRPAGLATPDYATPMRGELLWVYEGLTDYLGKVLAARSGLLNPEMTRDGFAFTAMVMQSHHGRSWRPLEDTATAAQLLYEARNDWQAWRRGVDFYPEGDLLWLEVDTMLREKSNGQKSIDDFCMRFHGGESGAPMVKPYAFADVVTALNETVPFDWAGFLEQRVRGLAPDAPVGGIERGGWKVVYTPEEGEYQRDFEKADKFIDLRASIGVTLDADKNAIVDVIPGEAADRAGLAPAMHLVAVNGRKYSADVLKDAIAGTKDGGKLELIVENAEMFETVRLDYKGGARYPHLERVAQRPDLLGEIFKAHATK